MTAITQHHFGGNIVLTRDSAPAGGAYQDMLKEINFSSFRYPGGSVTEHQTWQNGGLAKVFGPPMDAGSDNAIMTMREALQLSIDHNARLTIVVPTFQFWEEAGKIFDAVGFDRYLDELEKALVEYPEARINGFEIGNEYWSQITAADYGIIASHEIMGLHHLNKSMANQLGSDWEPAGIGIQAGAGWRASGVSESKQIAATVSEEARPFVTTIYQHAYPNAVNGIDGQIDRNLKTMKVFSGLEGFGDLKLSLSEFNMNKDGPMGTDQAGHWIETFGKFVEGGIDEIYTWGTQYAWQSNKLYDSLLNKHEKVEGTQVIATPMGQMYDLAESHLIGKNLIDDGDAAAGLGIPEQVNITGFEGDGQRIVFLHNRSDEKVTVDLSNLEKGGHLSVYHMTSADSPYTALDESDRTPRPGETVDARGDMNVRTEGALGDEQALAPGDVIMMAISDIGKDLVLEGAHNVTDPRTGMANDQITGGTGEDILRGHVGDDILDGEAGNDVITGGRGDDVLSGGLGNDVLIADHGSDIVDGGEGDDLVLVHGSGDNEITSIDVGEGQDVILSTGAQNIAVSGFSADDAIGLGGVFEDGEALSSALSVDEQDLLLTLPGGQEIRFIGGADLLERMSDLVIDFRSSDEVVASLEDVFSGLTEEQIAEVYEQSPGFGGLAGNLDGWQTAGDAIESMLPTPPPSREEPDTGSVDSGINPAGFDPASQEPNSSLGYASNYDDDDHVPDPPVEDPQDYTTASGGGCFVATAAYGDRLHPDVVALRHFRDHHLIYTAAGRGLVRFYWIVGPRLAAVTKPDQPHAAIARALLTPLVRILRALGKTDAPAVKKGS